MVFEADDSLVADSDPEDIRRQVFESSVAFTNGLDINDPVALPDLCGDLLKQLGLFERIPKLCPKDFGDGSFGHEIVTLGWQPAFTVGGDATAGHDKVSVHVVARGGDKFHPPDIFLKKSLKIGSV